MLGVEPPTSGLLGQNTDTRLSWHVRLNSVKVCAQQSMPNNLQFGSWQ